MERNARIYRIWAGMKQRCNNPNHPAARWYHDKGIRVCQEWENNFPAFQKWAMANGYFENASIDRINPDDGYKPDNCRWITLQENRIRALKGRKYKGVPIKRIRAAGPKKVEERIVDLINKIKEHRGEEFAAGLVEGINMATPRVETREETMEKIQFRLPYLDDRQLRLVSAFIRGMQR